MVAGWYLFWLFNIAKLLQEGILYPVAHNNNITPLFVILRILRLIEQTSLWHHGADKSHLFEVYFLQVFGLG